MPLAVEVVRGVELLLFDHAGQAVEMITIVAGESTEITVATSPLLIGSERVVVALSVAEGLALGGRRFGVDRGERAGFDFGGGFDEHQGQGEHVDPGLGFGDWSIRVGRGRKRRRCR